MISSRRRGKGKCDSASCTRVAMAVLVAANLLLCFIFGFFHLQHVEAAQAIDFGELDFSKLYDPPPGMSTPELPNLARDAQSQMEAVQPTTRIWSLTNLRKEPEAVVSPSPPMALALRLASCPVCGNQILGQLPTPLKKRAISCEWKEVPNTFLSDLVGVVAPDRLSAAKDICTEFGSACGGVTCSRSQGSDAFGCTARASAEPRASPAREVSYIKDCKFLEADCDEEAVKTAASNPFAKDMRGTAIVILAHNREADLRNCLESLLSIPEAALFTLHVSLDDPVAFATMGATIQRVASAHAVHIHVWKIYEQKPGDDYNSEMQKWTKMNTGKIAHHYWQVFERAFMEEHFEQVIFAEEDLLFSPDFLALFRSTAGLLDQDPSLWCVSAWNDFGFKGTATDHCRLQRTSYFPGLGFLLPRSAWLKIREEWPAAPTMGWDYWMRVAFRTFGKECIVPEVSRSHHAAAKGSSVSTAKQLRLFDAMAFADIPSTCVATDSCNHFGNISYLMEQEYESWMRKVIEDAPRLKPSELRLQNGKPLLKKLPNIVHVVPFQREEYAGMAEGAGLLPRNTKGSIPQDLRSEHYGVIVGRMVSQHVPLLLVDRRSPRGYLQEDEQLRLESDFEVIAGGQGQSCEDVCKQRRSSCDKNQLYFLNDCNLLRKHFACEAGCAHQVGKELPVYVPDSFQPTHRQCLLTFISPMTCEAKHPSTARLCACRVIAPAPTSQRI
ncbi:unnamed protein product [Effrenium voratum]|uniref:alpha-1,3-mannosyl-glycoprotein 2-beta-N-acetylglucosaminyltransferase n=1 Tax=Effrenium voratum TaxID=2562239 RepID=A0AA36I938_9DINO|nr:unnamed protein product [Effrenium voratum]CAJ1448107.1 unnamed protein product [Effrenium voratum]